MSSLVDDDALGDRLQALGAFDKSAVDAAELSGQEIARVLVRLGLGPPELAVKLTNGGCAANYRCVLREGPPVVLKACVGDDCRALASAQLDVLARLAKASPGVAPAMRSLNVVACTTTAGRPACAVAMVLVPGRACNLLVDDGDLDERDACELLGTALADVHASPMEDDDDNLPAIDGDGWIERYARCAAPVDDYVGDLRPWDPAEPTGFVRWALVESGSLERCRRALRDASATLPVGLLHGDPYPDNLMHSVASGKSTFVDWEDVGRGPLVFDVASAAVGACFLHNGAEDAARLVSSPPPRAALKVECMRRLVHAYSRGRRRAVLRAGLSEDGARPRSASVCLGFTTSEAAALPGLMAANAFACALYRFYTFHVADKAAPRGAKRAYREMQAVCLALGDEEVVAQIREAADAAVGVDGSAE